jgi:threonine aldolase
VEDLITFLVAIAAIYYGIRWTSIYVEQLIRTAPQRAESRRIDHENKIARRLAYKREKQRIKAKLQWNRESNRFWQELEQKLQVAAAVKDDELRESIEAQARHDYELKLAQLLKD